MYLLKKAKTKTPEMPPEVVNRTNGIKGKFNVKNPEGTATTNFTIHNKKTTKNFKIIFLLFQNNMLNDTNQKLIN